MKANRLLAAGAVAAALALIPAAGAGAATHHKVTPACKNAIHYASMIDIIAGQAFGIAAKYPTEYSPIATAAENGDAGAIDNIVASVKGWNTQLNALVAQMTTTAPKEAAAAGACLAGE